MSPRQISLVAGVPMRRAPVLGAAAAAADATPAPKDHPWGAERPPSPPAMRSDAPREAPATPPAPASEAATALIDGDESLPFLMEAGTCERADRVYSVALDQSGQHMLIGGRDKKCCLVRFGQLGAVARLTGDGHVASFADSGGSGEVLWEAHAEDVVYTVRALPCASMTFHSPFHACFHDLPPTFQ